MTQHLSISHNDASPGLRVMFAAGLYVQSTEQLERGGGERKVAGK